MPNPVSSIQDIITPLNNWLGYESDIRTAKRPNAYHIIHHYLDNGLGLLQHHDRATQIQVLLRMHSLLVDVVCDVLLPLCWRQYCLELLYQPTQALERLMHAPQERAGLCAMQQRTIRLCRYFIS